MHAVGKGVGVDWLTGMAGQGLQSFYKSDSGMSGMSAIR